MNKAHAATIARTYDAIRAYNAKRQAEYEAHLRTQEGEAERNARNNAMVRNMREQQTLNAMRAQLRAIVVEEERVTDDEKVHPCCLCRSLFYGEPLDSIPPGTLVTASRWNDDERKYTGFRGYLCDMHMSEMKNVRYQGRRG